MKKPVIGILTNLVTVEEGPYTGGERIYVNRDYVRCVLEAGGIPILLPILDDLATIREQIRGIDGLLLSGGQDVSPHYYNEMPHEHLGAVSQDRDFFEMAAIKVALAEKKPLLGVCRGLQILNIALGGTLYQDIPSLVKNPLTHMQKDHRHNGTHEVTITPTSQLYKILQKEKVLTNSFHHQSIKDVASGLHIVGTSSDGVVEAVEGSDTFLLGLQWHPEMMNGCPDMKKLFVAFVAASRSG